MEILQREFIYVWYYFDIQFRQVFRYWVLGMAIGSAVSVFGKDKVHAAFSALGNRKPGVRFYDYGASDKDYKPGRIKDCVRHETFCAVSGIRHAFFTGDRAACKFSYAKH